MFLKETERVGSRKQNSLPLMVLPMMLSVRQLLLKTISSLSALPVMTTAATIARDAFICLHELELAGISLLNYPHLMAQRMMSLEEAWISMVITSWSERRTKK